MVQKKVTTTVGFDPIFANRLILLNYSVTVGACTLFPCFFAPPILHPINHFHDREFCFHLFP